MSVERRNPQGDDAGEVLGILDSTGAIGIGLLGEATAQIPVALPVQGDDDLDDDDVVDGEAFAGLVLDADPASLVRADDGIGRIHRGAGVSDIVIEVAADAEDVVVAELVDDGPVAEHDEVADQGEDDGSPDQPAPQERPASEVPAEGAAEEGAHGTDMLPAAEEDSAAFDEDPVDGDEIGHVVDDAHEAVGAARPSAAGEEAAVEAPAGDSSRGEASDDDPAEDLIVEPARAESGAADEALDAGVPENEDSAQAGAAGGGHRPPAADEHREAADADPMPAEIAAAASPAPAPVAILADERASAAEPGTASRRSDQLGDRARESADLLTADRLLDRSRLADPEPEGLWSHLLYTVSGRRINLGDGRRAQQRKALSARIAAPLSGTARFVPVLSRKGGVGKTTVTALLGMALADAREDRIIAVDANPDRGTLADRIARTNSKTVRDLVRIHDQVTGYHDISAVVSRDATRLDVLASDADPRVSEAFSDEDYDQVASVAAHYYSLVLTDTGTGIVHSVMGATLDRADTLVVVAGLSVDEARLASETLTWLEANGYADKVREAVVVLNQSTPGAPMVRLDELEAHFRSRVAQVLRLPYDARIAAGSAITFAALQPETRQAARELAAIVVEGLRAQAA